MRELRACDFCGGDAHGVYEPLPPELGADQRRVALCAACRDTLEELLAPLEDERTTGTTSPDRAETGSDAETSSAEARGETSGAGRSETGSSFERSDAASPGSGGVTIEEDDSTAASTTEGAEADTSEGETASADDPNGDANGEPPGFRQVMRLLNNRSFPVERTVAVELASGAYDLSESEVEAAIEHAVERGVLADAGGELRRA